MSCYYDGKCKYCKDSIACKRFNEKTGCIHDLDFAQWMDERRKTLHLKVFGQYESLRSFPLEKQYKILHLFDRTGTMSLQNFLGSDDYDRGMMQNMSIVVGLRNRNGIAICADKRSSIYCAGIPLPEERVVTKVFKNEYFIIAAHSTNEVRNNDNVIVPIELVIQKLLPECKTPLDFCGKLQNELKLQAQFKEREIGFLFGIKENGLHSPFMFYEYYFPRSLMTFTKVDQDVIYRGMDLLTPKAVSIVPKGDTKKLEEVAAAIVNASVMISDALVGEENSIIGDGINVESLS